MDAGSDRRRAFRAGVARTGDVVRVVLHGPADVTAVDELEAVLQPLPAGGPVEIDLRDVDFLDSSALRVLLRFDARVRRTGAEVRFVRGPARVERIFEVLGLAGQVAFVDPPGAQDPPSPSAKAPDGSP